jgi:alkylhydroperoxidase/carboxymuconolactone decarboxylase family protein YurZ
MDSEPQPPKAHQLFVESFPKLAEAWEKINEAGQEGPLDKKMARLLKLAVAIGAMREGAVHSSVRKALAAGISRAELLQVVALSAGTLGLPATVAAFSWVLDETDKQ